MSRNIRELISDGGVFDDTSVKKIHDAIGVRLTELPMNPEAVFEALSK